MRQFLLCVAVVAISGAAFVNADEKVPLEKLPKVVSDAVKKKFPKAELVAATQEKEDGVVEYEVTVKENGKKIDVTIQAGGKIESFEKEMDIKELPKPVVEALEKMYPKAVHKSAEAVFEVEGGKDELEFYEIQLKTAADKEVEAKIKADGTIAKDDDDDD